MENLPSVKRKDEKCKHEELDEALAIWMWQLYDNKKGNAHINVTLRGVRVTIVAVDKQYKYYIFRVCVSSLSYPACKANAPNYDIICDLSGSTISSHIIS